MILENGLYDQFLDIEERCLADKLNMERDKMLQSIFSQAIKLNYISIAMKMMLKFESALLRSANTTLPTLISNLKKNKTVITEIKLSLL